MLSEDRLREKLRKIEALYAGATTAGEKSAAGACSAPPKRADAEEDKLHGQDKRGGEMPDWVADKQRRAEKIRQAKAELEAEAKAAAETELKERAAAEAKREAEGRRQGGRKAAPSPTPDAKAQKNFTDPQSRVMKSKDGFVQAYNAQIAVDAEASSRT